MFVQDEDCHPKLRLLLEDFRATEIPITQKLLRIDTFVKFIQEHSPSLEIEDIDDLLESIEPTDFSAKRLKLELANKFHRPLIILEYIKKEEKCLIKRALQFLWIFDENYCTPLTNPKTLVRVILPSVSYSTRLKILSGLSKKFQNEKSCEQLFTLICEKYGTGCALELLPACSVGFINHFFTDNPNATLMLTRHQSLRLVKKDHLIALEFLTIILEYLKSIEVDSSSNQITKFNESRHKLFLRLRSIHQNTFYHLCLNFPKKFLDLYAKYTDLISFFPKPQATKVLMTTATCKALILSNGQMYNNILNHSVLRKYISLQEFIQFFASMLPSIIEEFHSAHENLMITWINRFSISKRWKIIKESFKLKYSKDLTTCPEYISPLIIEVMPKDIKEEVIMLKIKKNDPGRISYTTWEHLPQHREGFWSSFLTVDKSIPKIKKLLAHESCPKTRAELLTCLLDTCHRNGKDTRSLVDVCKFVLEKYRNDEYLVRSLFITALHNKFKLNNLLKNAALWETLIEFIKLSSAYNEPEQPTLLEGAIRYRLLHNLPIGNLASNFTKVMELNSCFWIGGWPYYSRNPDLEKKFFKFFIEEVAKMCSDKKDNDKVVRVMMNILHTISDWQRKERKAFRKTFTVTEYPWLTSKLLDISNFSNTDLQPKILKIIRSDPSLLKSCFQTFLTSDPYAPILDYCLKINPAEILINLEIILIFMLSMDGQNFKRYHHFLTQLKTQSFPEIASPMIEICLETVQDDGRDDLERRNALVILSHLWDSTNYLHTTALFNPTSPKIDLLVEDFESRYDVKKAIVESLNNTSFPHQCLGPLSQFCLGDYVKISVGPLYSACTHSPHQQAIQFLKEDLLDSPVSVKKHVIKLLCTLADLDEIEELLTYLWENETHPSIREVLLSKLCHFLAIHPKKDKAWSLVKSCLLTLSTPKKEKSTMELLQEFLMPHNRTNIPRNLLPDYFSMCYKIISDDENLPSDDGHSHLRNNLFQHFMQILTTNISILPGHFIKSLIEKYLFNFVENESGESRESSDLIASLTVRFLIGSINEESTLTDRMALVTSKLLLLKSQWNLKKTVLEDKTSDDDHYIIPSSSSTFPARKALNNFVQELCQQVVNLKEDKEGTACKKLGVILSEILETIMSHFDPAETFSDRLFLQLSVVFLDIIGVIELQNGANDVNLFRERLMQAGQKLRKLTDATLLEYHPAIFSLYYEKLIFFYNEIVDLKSPTEQPGWLFVLKGLLGNEGDSASIENQILACKLMVKNCPSNIPCLEVEYNELMESLSKLPTLAVKAVINAELYLP